MDDIALNAETTTQESPERMVPSGHRCHTRNRLAAFRDHQLVASFAHGFEEFETPSLELGYTDFPDSPGMFESIHG